MKLVIYPAVDDIRLAKIESAAGPMSVVNLDEESAAVAAIRDADAFFGKLTPPMLAAATRLRWVQSPTASLEHYIFPELVDHPCTLTNMRGLFGPVITDHVFAYLLCFARNLHLYLRQQMSATWAPIGGESARSTFAAGPGQVSAMDRAHTQLSDCRLGIVGLGAIGREIAERATAFRMDVVAVDPYPPPPLPGINAVWGLDRLDELLTTSDFVVIAAPHTPHTEGMFARPQFQRMKPSAYLVNIGRGAIVKLDDLVASLEAGEIAGAALDVFEVEPLPAAHPLWAMENVIMTPHVAACSVQIAPAHLAVLLENIRRFVSGQELINQASKTLWF